MAIRPILIATLSAVVASGAAEAASVVTLAPTSGHPSQTIAGAGAGFADDEPVDLYFDTVDTQLLISSSVGGLGFSLPIPASATPGPHTVTAIGRQSGDAAQATLTVSTPWAEDGYGAAHLRWNPFENVLSPTTVPMLGILWSGAVTSTGGTPAVANGRVYVGTTTGVAALSSTTGVTLWTATLGSAVNGSPAASGFVYAVASAGTVYALNANVGSTAWTNPLLGNAIDGSPVVVNGVVYIGDSAGKVFALQASSGKTLWTYSGAGGTAAAAAVANGTVFVTMTNGAVDALNAATGALVWTATITGGLVGGPAVANNLVYVGSPNGVVFALHATGQIAGQTAWSYTTAGSSTSGPAVAGGLVFGGDFGGNVDAFNAHTGALAWQQALGTRAGVASVAVANGVVYASTFDGSLYALTAATGAVLTAAYAGNTNYGAPAVSDGTVYLAANEQPVFAFAPGAGAEVVRRRQPLPGTLHPDFSLRARE